MEFTNILGEKITLGNKPGEVKNRKVLDNAPRVEYSPDKPERKFRPLFVFCSLLKHY